MSVLNRLWGEGAPRRRRWMWVSCALAVAAAATATLAVERSEPAPAELDGVGLTERLDAEVPLSLSFVDEAGVSAPLSRWFEPGRPVILTLNYYRCPMLCTLVLNGLVQALKEVDLEPGRDYRVVTVSIDPRETPQLAKAKKQSYLESLGRAGAEDAWRFLTGREEAIRALAGAVGFGYRYVAEDNQYAHPAAIYVLTPEGRVSRQLSGVLFEPRTVRWSLVEASRGKIGSPIDQFILYCFHYDAEKGRYAPAALRIMRVGGGLTAIVLGVVLGFLWIREKKIRGKRLP